MKLNNPIKSVIPSSIPSLQAACLLIGMGVSLIPVLPRTFPFWGGSYLWSDRGHEHILVTGVVPQSPANAAGLLRGDQLLTADGQEVVNFLDWTPMIERLEPGQPMVIEVIRDGQTLLLTARGQQPQLAGIIYFDWQYPFAVGYGILLVFLLATLRARPTIILWRSAQLLVFGLGLTAMLVLLREDEGRVTLLQFRPIGPISHPWEQLLICIVVASGFTIISLFGVRDSMRAYRK